MHFWHQDVYFVITRKNAMKSHEKFLFDHINSSNSTMVGEIFENVELQIPTNAMKTHEQFMFD